MNSLNHYDENPDLQPLREVLDELRQLRTQMHDAGLVAADLYPVHPQFRVSALNLSNYLAMRRQDLRPLQTQLAALGLSSLGRCESAALHTVDRLIAVLERLTGEQAAFTHYATASDDGLSAPLQEHAVALFGQAPADRAVRIMVTMPSEAADEPIIIEQMLLAGMNCQRINCAHDGPEVWGRMIEHLRAATDRHGLPCQVVMDLAGPKVRTGRLAPGPSVLRIKPTRDEFGQVIRPARLLLTSTAPEQADSIQIGRKWLEALRVDDRLSFKDSRLSKRSMRIVEVTEQGCWAELEKTAYLVPGTRLKLKPARGRNKTTRVKAVPVAEQPLRLQEGDRLILTRDDLEGRPAMLGSEGRVLEPARIGCTSAIAFEAVRVDQPILFDDGKLGGHVIARDDQHIDVQITHAPGGAKLRADKGINLPLTDLPLQALSEEDIDALEFASQHADIVELSFVNTADDVRGLLAQLERLDARHMGVVLKIETRLGFENLPELLLAGMQHPRLGVMIARGDLAVETGFERTAELQEEMLSLCEAAHVPVIWATQVLESLAKTGLATRAEMTDAAMGVRAECVMLNKGPHILKAIEALHDLLQRMQDHHVKKRAMLRRLGVAVASPVMATTQD
ncbi:pyruvate kinase [Pseudomonas sp. v388]|uniref:pyruvate kinase n=1 Tax=Pseudomonas sp. v388 TaxID=2479849 RepID=UPI000F777797|nr:pyruvate kinase [Pseudomonas sp. v388]RRV07270.1 pyruvate kinase [Pseudomonas sp. v388]